jgi:hypothetical protein
MNDQLPQPLADVERTALIKHLTRLLLVMPIHELRINMDQIAGAGTADRILLEHRRLAALAQQQLEQQIAEARRRDPGTAARAEAWARSMI